MELEANLLQLIRWKGRHCDNYHGRNRRQSWQSCLYCIFEHFFACVKFPESLFLPFLVHNKLEFIKSYISSY